ncbi:hypothetical protein GQ53DRAFT_137871 [Thozetella sp. PMI_491]|nr:hypothetical protein GQ53DRAFT_137871 [Thozetella sp. PMI_491]
MIFLLTRPRSKRRHVKCDEKRPKCMICTLSDRECSYASDFPASSPAPGGKSSQPQTPATTPVSPSDVSTSGPQLDQPTATVPNLADVASVLPAPDPDLDESVNMVHMELLLNFSIDHHVPDLVGTMKEEGTAILLKAAMEAPYLMHELLAISASHLATTNPAKSDFYHRQAVHLQTRAVSLFNETKLEVNEQNCVHMLLFSSSIGRHLLTDVLARRDPDLGTFLDRYTQCGQLHKGLRAIAHTSWPYLLKTDLKPMLAWGSQLGKMPLRGNECDHLRELVTSSTSLSDADKVACGEAIHYLQIGLDGCNEDSPRENWCQMIFTWSVIVPPEYNELVMERRPEALVILAHYALLLHNGRELWQIKDAGVYLFNLITQFLGPAWEKWLAMPRERMQLA